MAIKPGYRTDHSCLTMTVQVIDMEKGPGIWKINESILQDSEYIELVNSTIKNTVYQYAIPVYNEEYLSDSNNYENIDFTIRESLFYETLLMLIRGETVQYCKRKARTRRSKEKELLFNVQSAQTAFDQDKCDEKMHVLQKAKEDLEEHRKPYIEGLIVRSRTQWHEEGEKSSKYFLSLEKRNASKKSIQLIENEGKTITNSRAILSLFTHALREKYNDQGHIEPNVNFIRRNLSEVLTENEKNALDEHLTFQELTTALGCMKKGRTPGSNGFSVDFFRCFWQTLGVFLHRACISSFSEGTTLPTHRESLITLIPKSGRPSNSLKSWRPISLLNVDYKIISTAIANRFKKVVNKIISPSQTAYIKGRYIGENSRLVYDVISHVNKSKQTGLIMAADFEAAFETISWQYVNAVLKEMNFGEYFRELVNLLYLNQDNFSRILLNGFLGEKIYMHKGIRQGDPVSGFLFNIAAEILSKQISQSKNLSGIKVNTNIEIRISQYADDTILFLDGTKRSLNGAVMELVRFSAQSGLKVNWEKTTCLPLGRLSHVEVTENDFTAKIRWVDEIKILGMYFRDSITNITELNLEKKLVLLENDIAQWKRRYITPVGKITVIKSLLLAKLVHIFMALPNPSDQYIKRIEGTLYKFLWNDKPDRIKRTKIVQSYKFDGLQMIDLTSFLHALKLSWLKRLFNSTAVWTDMAKSEHIDHVKLLMYGTVKLKQTEANITNVFWKDVIKSLIKFNQVVLMKPENILSESLWYSDYTKFKTTKISRWDMKGLRFIGDLFNPNGKLLLREEIVEKYGASMTFLCYMSLIRSLPAEIKNRIYYSFTRPNIPYRMQLFLSKNGTRHYYSLFVETLRKKCNTSDANLVKKWNRDIGFHQQGSLLRMRKATKSVNLFYLHYKIITRTITTNKFLHAIDISDSSICTFCKRETETILHLFWHCSYTQSFIRDIDRELYTRYQIRFKNDEKSWFFLHETDEMQTLLITLGKLVLYRARNNGEKPKVSHMLRLLKIEATKEEFASRLYKNPKQFYEKWKTLKNVLCNDEV